jgi:hypothetical protein
LLSLLSFAATMTVSPWATRQVINRSEIVGRPLAAMLANDGATVYSVVRTARRASPTRLACGGAGR